MPHVPLEVRRFRDEIYQSSFGFKLNEELEGDPDGPLTRLLLNTEEGQSAGKLRQLVEKATKHRQTLEIEFALEVKFPQAHMELRDSFLNSMKGRGIEVSSQSSVEGHDIITTDTCNNLDCADLLKPLVRDWQVVGATLFIYAIPKE